ncbi:neuronal-specific septin-3 isoform X2 [Anolis carolinensis]|uniref:neuronal-specific septin-3 isoform X2 n=1 Tax=Anolis carolinensis TaxID=28377 RepID=UPI000462E744|nr:PREDICTED: neuronal-specific septin-3 isoform X2 [Anolis carolinensis]|eukprot:XP_008108969.1 PREDICTED: neuronal-specific septin-3 isoform X2 [Anolis carolinensis]
MMEKEYSHSSRGIQRCIPTLGASSNPSRIPGRSTHSVGSGKLAAVNPILKQDTCLNSFMQDSMKRTSLGKGQGIPKLNSRLGPPKPPRSHEVLTSCLPHPTSQSPQWATANGLEPRKLSSLSFTLHQSSSTPPPGRQLLLHYMAKRELKKVPLRKEARRGESRLPSPQSPSGLQTLPPIADESSTDLLTACCHEGENHVTEIPGPQKNVAPSSPPSLSPQSSPETIPKNPTISVPKKETVQEEPASEGRCDVPNNTDAGSGKVLLLFPQECLEDEAVGANLISEESTSPPETNLDGFECSAETKPEAAMSEVVPEPRPKPVVPMKPVGINSNLLGYIGIDTIIEQMRKKTMKTGFDFNIMVVGQSGLGKSTLVNTLFKSQVSRKSSGWNREEKIPKTVEIKAIGHVIEEGGVKMKLTVIDTPGFGDQINNENCWEPIEKYINEQYEKFLKEEVNIARKKRIPDTRVHCCLYFISPTGHSLRPLDMEFMKHLSKVVNIIPVIAKADTMTLEEKIEFKQRVRKELEVNGIEFYPQKEFDEDLEDKTENDKIRESMPFAVVGSDKEYQVNGKRVLGRKTPWGVIEVENLNHCEFALLRDFVIRTHLQDLKEVTHNIHYETYRAKRLNDNGGLPPVTVETEENHESNL